MSKQEQFLQLLAAAMPVVEGYYAGAQEAQERQRAASLRDLVAAHVLGGFTARSGPPDVGQHPRFVREALAMAEEMVKQTSLGPPQTVLGSLSSYVGVVSSSAGAATGRAARRDEPVGSFDSAGAR